LKPVLLVLFTVSFILQVRRPDLSFHGAVLGLVTNVIWLVS